MTFSRPFFVFRPCRRTGPRWSTWRGAPSGGGTWRTPGESAYLSGEYATAFTRGLQNSETDEAHWAAGATCKHYVANSMEHTTEVGVTHDRAEFNASVSMQDLVYVHGLDFGHLPVRGTFRPAIITLVRWEVRPSFLRIIFILC